MFIPPRIADKRTEVRAPFRFAILLGLMILLVSARPAGAQSGIELTDIGADYDFGKQIVFSVRITPAVPVQSATVTFGEPEGISQTRSLTVNPDGTAEYRYDASLNALAAFSPIVFWFTVTLPDGTVIQSGTYNIVYADDRFAWRTLERGTFRAHWYEGDETFGGEALDAANRGLQAVSGLIPVGETGPIDIWVYANAQDLQGALFAGGEAWVAGHAGPQLGVVMISIDPASERRNIELERQTPHELAHVLLYRRIGADYERLPAWLTEGIATMAEAELYPNPDFVVVLNAAAQENSVIPLADLCDSFPSDTGNAFLAYAEAESFTRFIVDNYGTTGLSALVSAYADGLDCEQGARHALNEPLSRLEIRWRETKLGENRGGVIAFNLFPYLILLGLVLIVPVWGAIGRILERRKNARQV
ncbi:MAG: peptidase MA family metallohydrolase [Chloroflexota bacterium]